MCSTDASLAESVDALAAVPVESLPIGGLMELVEDAASDESLRRGGVAAVGELQVRGGGQVPDPAVAGAVCPTPAWLRVTAKVSGNTAGRQVRTAVALRELPAVADAIVDGAISVEHGQVLARLVGNIEPQALLADQITAAQRRAVAARDRCCTAKGCSRPLAFCDLHHLRARADGGSTDMRNLVLLCRRHHVMWHREQLNLPELRVPWKRLPQPRAPSLT